MPRSRSRWKARSRTLLATSFLLVAATAAAQDLPEARGRVSDFANVIDPATEAAIERQLEELERKTSSEIAVTTVAALHGMSVDEYANRLFKEWGVGQARLDNGVLVLVAPNVREIRIEVGYGLEGVLPDGLAGQVIRDNFKPRMRAGDYSGGMADGVTRLVQIVEQHQVLTPEAIATLNQPDAGFPFDILILVGVVVITAVVLGQRLRALGAKGLVALMLVLTSAACGYLPAAQERKDAEQILRGITDVSQATVDCASVLLANDGLCAEVVMKDHARLRFERVGFKSFGSFAVNVVVAEASGLAPRVASCDGVGAPNFHREGPLGHHFHPTLIDLKEAVSRYREILEEVEFWPQCPQFWEVQDKRGRNYRYCARRKDATDEPPMPAGCS